MKINKSQEAPKIPDFTRRVLKLKISCSFYDGKAASDKAAQAAAKSEGADPGSVEAKIIAIERKALRPISGPMTTMQALWRSKSRPWEDGGWRLVKIQDFPALIAELEKMQREVRDAVREFVKTQYDTIKAEAKKRLNGLLEDHFPSRERMLERYDVRILIDQVAPLDLPVDGLSAKQAQEIVDRREKLFRDNIDTGNRAMIGDILKAAKALQETLADDKKNYHGIGAIGFPLIDNVLELCDHLESMNITGDQKVSETCAKVREVLKGIDMESAREDRMVRKEATLKAKSLLDDLKSF